MELSENEKRLQAVFDNGAYAVLDGTIYRRSDSGGLEFWAPGNTWSPSDLSAARLAAEPYAITITPAENPDVLNVNENGCTMYFIDAYSGMVKPFSTANHRGMSLAAKYFASNVAFDTLREAAAIAEAVAEFIQQKRREFHSPPEPATDLEPLDDAEPDPLPEPTPDPDPSTAAEPEPEEVPS